MRKILFGLLLLLISTLLYAQVRTRGGSVFPNLTVGGSSPTNITNIRIYSQSITPAATPAAIGTTAQTFTVTGLTTTDKVIVNVPGITSLCPMVHARVSAADTLQLWFSTLTSPACTPAAGTHVILAIRS